MNRSPRPLSVVLLAGGFGTRLRTIHPELPKPMIPVAGRPFLDWVLKFWRSQGVEHAVLSIHHLPESFLSHFASEGRLPANLDIVCEPEPLGTGGAVQFAVRSANVSDPFFVANADSLAWVDVAGCEARMRDSGADGLIFAVEAVDASRFGTVSATPDGRLISFLEKRPGPGLINAGIYLLRKNLLRLFPTDKPLSMETGVFPALLQSGARILVVAGTADFIDIGTPESLIQAQAFVLSHFFQDHLPQNSRRVAL